MGGPPQYGREALPDSHLHARERDVWQRTQGTSADSGDVESEWLETLLLPSQRCSLTNDESFRKLCHTPKKTRDVNEGSLSASKNVCTAAVYPGLPLNLCRKFKVEVYFALFKLIQYKMVYRISRLTNDEE